MSHDHHHVCLPSRRHGARCGHRAGTDRHDRRTPCDRGAPRHRKDAPCGHRDPRNDRAIRPLNRHDAHRTRNHCDGRRVCRNAPGRSRDDHRHADRNDPGHHSTETHQNARHSSDVPGRTGDPENHHSSDACGLRDQDDDHDPPRRCSDAPGWRPCAHHCPGGGCYRCPCGDCCCSGCPNHRRGALNRPHVGLPTETSRHGGRSHPDGDDGHRDGRSRHGHCPCRESRCRENHGNHSAVRHAPDLDVVRLSDPMNCS